MQVFDLRKRERAVLRLSPQLAFALGLSGRTRRSSVITRCARDCAPLPFGRACSASVQGVTLNSSRSAPWKELWSFVTSGGAEAASSRGRGSACKERSPHLTRPISDDGHKYSTEDTIMKRIPTMLAGGLCAVMGVASTAPAWAGEKGYFAGHAVS